MRYYKLMSMFSFEGGNEVHFGEGMASFCNDREQYEKLKEFIKEQKKWVKSIEADITDLKLRVWWLQIKLVEFGVFSPGEHRSMFALMTI